MKANLTKQEQAIADDAQAIRDKQQQRQLALFVGLFAFLIPLYPLFWPGMVWRLPQVFHQPFYYSPFWGGIFIGMLAFIGTYMIAYRSVRRDERMRPLLVGSAR